MIRAELRQQDGQRCLHATFDGGHVFEHAFGAWWSMKTADAVLRDDRLCRLLQLVQRSPATARWQPSFRAPSRT
jgi:hypothetical protein